MDNTIQTKPWYTSKTIWLALAQFVVAVIGVWVTGNPASHYAAIALMFKSMADIYIRQNTNTTIG